MNLQIELNQEQLEKLFASGLIHPSDVRCLNNESKETVKQMCLELCQPSHCHRCDRRMQCAQVVFDALPNKIGTVSAQSDYIDLK